MDEDSLMKKRRKANRDGNVQVLADVQKKLGDLFYDRKCYDDALEAYKGQLHACECLNDKLNCAIAHRMIGEVYADIGNFEEALSHQNLYLNIAVELGDLIEEQRAFATLGRTYLLVADSLIKNSETDKKMEVLKDANKAFSKSIRLCDKLENKINVSELMMMRARLLLNLGLVREQQKDTTEALSLVEQASALCKKHNLHEDLHRTNITLAGLYERLGNTELALKNFDEAAKANDVNMKNNALLLKAELLLKLGEWQESKKLLYKLYKSKKLLEPDKQQTIKLLKIAVVLCRSEDQLLTERSPEAMEKLYESLGDAATAVRCLDKAIDYYRRMLGCAEKSQSGQLAAALTSLAQTLRDAGRYAEALPYARRELELCTEPRDCCTSALYVADLMLESRASAREIRPVLEQALAAAGRCPEPKLQASVLRRHLDFLEREPSEARPGELEALRRQLLELQESQRSSVDEEEEEEEEPETPDIGADVCLDELTSDSESERELPELQSCRNVGRSSLKRKRCVVKRNEKGESQLHVACIKGNISAVEKLLEEHHPTDVRDHCGWTPLHEAANHGFAEIARLLIRAGARVNDPGGANCDGVTALHDAAANGHAALVQLLLDHGADPNLLTGSGESALDCLEQWRERVGPLGPAELKEYVLAKRRLAGLTTLRRDRKRPGAKQRKSNALLDHAEAPAREQPAAALLEMGKAASEKLSAGEDYKRTIASLQRPGRPLLPAAATATALAGGQSRPPALIDSEEMLVDTADWLEDDIGPRAQLRRERLPYFDGLPAGSTTTTSNAGNAGNVKRKSKSDELEAEQLHADEAKSAKRQRLLDHERQPMAVVISEDEDSRESCCISSDGTNDSVETAAELWPKRQQKKPRQKSLLQQGFTKELRTSRSPTPIRGPTTSPPPLACERRSWESSVIETLDLHITIDDELFELKLHFRDLKKTISDIEELMRHKFEARTGCRPKIKFKTAENIPVPAEWYVENIPKEYENKLKLYGEITLDNLPPIADRYRKVCEVFGIETQESTLRSLRSCENTSTFRPNSSEFGPSDEELEPLCKCLRYQLDLQSLSLSGVNFYGRGQLLAMTLSRLTGLSELQLQCCDIDHECLENLNALPTQLRVLDLAYNPLGVRSQGKLLQLLEPLKKLQNLNLRACELDDFRYKYESDSLVSLDISWNRIGGDGAANFLQKQLLSLNLSNTQNGKINVIDKIFFNESMKSKFFALESLELSSCQATDLDVEKILCQAPNLRRLILSNNRNVTRTSLSAILARKPSMNYIDLSSCRLIDAPPEPGLCLVAPHICILFVSMKPEVVSAWLALWQGKGRAKQLPQFLVTIEPS